MRFFRNKLVRVVFWLDLLITSASLLAVHLVLRTSETTEWPVLLAAGAGGLLNLVVFLVAAHGHFKDVRQFSEKVEKGLHGERNLQFEDFEEGDFYVLQDGIADMVQTHFRQEEMLQEEKKRLSEALENISHQIKTPLSSINLTAERLRKSDLEPLERKLLVQRMMDDIRHISEFVKMLLWLARMDAGVEQFRREKIPVSELIEKAYAPIEIAMDLQEKRFTTEIPQGAYVIGDKFWLREALENILKNCMDHTPPGGEISVHVKDNAVYTQIVIRDTGMGIDPQELPRIFERFYTGKNAHTKGVGIGLALTRMVIQKLGGTIRAENHPEKGAVFTIQLFKVNV